MMAWPLVHLADIVTDLQPGFACQPTDDPRDTPQLRTNNVSPEGRIDLSELKRVPTNAGRVKKYSLKPGDVLFNNTNSPALVGKTAFFDHDGLFLFSNHMTRIRVSRDVAEPRYVALYLHWSWTQGVFRTLITQWVNHAAINRNQLSSVRIPLAPLAEQRRISEILDQADRLRQLREHAHRLVDRMFLVLLQEAFSGKLTTDWRDAKSQHSSMVDWQAVPGNSDA